MKSTWKSLSATRWSCRYDLTKALWENYTVIKEAFFASSNSETEKRETKQEDDRICFKLGLLETAFTIVFWNSILERFQANILSSQSNTINLKTAVDILKSLKTCVVDQREQFGNFEAAELRIDGVEYGFRHEE